MTVMNGCVVKCADARWLDSASNPLSTVSARGGRPLAAMLEILPRVYAARTQQPSRRQSSVPMHEQYHLPVLKSRFADRLFRVISALLCIQGLLFVPCSAAQSLSDQLSDLLRQQLATR